MDESTRSVPTHVGPDGTPYANSLCSPVDNQVRAEACAPSPHVIPIVFSPGIMGSNLRAKQDILDADGSRAVRRGARIWNVDSETAAAGWVFKGPQGRQLRLNKDVVEVDDRGKIAQGKSIRSTARGDVLYVDSGHTELSKVPIDVARERGWGTVSWFSYGPFLDWLQHMLLHPQIEDGRPNTVLTKLLRLVGTTPPGATTRPNALDDAGVRKLLKFQFPVHAVGYNWLQSNLDSGRDLAEKIRSIISGYDGRNGQHCSQAIVVTHSMGGLVTRAAALLHGGDQQILGVISGVQPIDGAAAFYKRLAAGFSSEGSGVFAAIANKALGATARQTTPIIAYNPGPLELAPNQLYNGGQPWLFVKNAQGRTIKALPERRDPYTEIFRDTQSPWRAINPEWLNPADLPVPEGATNLDSYFETVSKAEEYHTLLGGRVHPKTYGHYGEDAQEKAWGTITWRVAAGRTYIPPSFYGSMPLPQWIEDKNGDVGDPSTWQFERTPSDSERSLRSSHGELRMTVQPPNDAGDGTVPAAASGAQLLHASGCQLICRQAGYDHQGSYNHNDVRLSVLDNIVRIVEPVVVMR